jgi:NADH-quinone oxidoreductase subunit J
MMNEFLIQIIFYILAAVVFFSAIMVISQNNPVRCVLFLVLTFFASAGIWLLAEAEFLSLILILVYVGAVMTLFLFVVMMLNIDVESIKSHYMRYLPFGLILVAFLTGLLLVSIPPDLFKVPREPQSLSVPASDLIAPDESNKAVRSTISNTESLGLVLYTEYLLAFEIAAVILLVAIVSAITLAHRGVIRSKRQDIKKQIMTRPEDRVQLINMQSEK